MSLGDLFGTSALAKVQKYLGEHGLPGVCHSCGDFGNSCAMASTLEFAGCLEFHLKDGATLPRIPEEYEVDVLPKTLKPYEPVVEPQPVYAPIKSMWEPKMLEVPDEKGLPFNDSWSVPSVYTSPKGARYVVDPATEKEVPMSSRFYAYRLEFDEGFPHCGAPSLVFQWSSLAPTIRVCMGCKMFLDERDRPPSTEPGPEKVGSDKE